MNKQITAVLTIYGKVQGVGFRPLVCRLAKVYHLQGFVQNVGTHVEVVATGVADDIKKFCSSIKATMPPVRVDIIHCEEIALQHFTNFESVESTDRREVRYVSADIGICENCLRDLNENGNRRAGYAYISCAQCGPRYTIIRNLPYDRKNTTMDVYALCDECASEYNDMENRRGHGETISCYHCGPQLKCFIKKEVMEAFHLEESIFPLQQRSVKQEPSEFQNRAAINAACFLLKEGRVIMVKAVGGFNLLCRADRADVVALLRDLKQRMSKPFAVMMNNVDMAERFCYVSAEEKELLQSAARPVVLLQKKKNVAVRIADNVTDCSDQMGVFLPSMGFYKELDVDFPFIVTSCNYTGEPILYRDEDAQKFFTEHTSIAALFTYEREILRPADDAVTRIIHGKAQVLRRTKGYMPEPAITAHPYGSGSVLSVGAQMEPGFCLTAQGYFFPAEIPGDITLEQTERCFSEAVQDWLELLSVKPKAVIGDLHPGYASTQWGKGFADKNGLPFYQVQHHHAHALSVMAEYQLIRKVLAVCFDGTGLGVDGTVWGGEFLLCEGRDFTRVGHLKPVPILGGDASMQQAWKTALCYLADAEMFFPDSRLPVVKAALRQKINVIETSSMGRLFDATASLLGLADFNSHQGRCAMALESAARSAISGNISPLLLSFKIQDAETKDSKTVFDPAPLWEPICKSCGNETTVYAAALGFHHAIVRTVVHMALQEGIEQIVLTGGCFANRILLETCTQELQKRGFRVYYNKAVSPGDGGISLGQAYYGALQ